MSEELSGGNVLRGNMSRGKCLRNCPGECPEEEYIQGNVRGTVRGKCSEREYVQGKMSEKLSGENVQRENMSRGKCPRNCPGVNVRRVKYIQGKMSVKLSGEMF